MLEVTLFFNYYCHATKSSSSLGAIGGQIYRANDAPLYAVGNVACMSLMIGVVIFSLSFKALLIKENKRRDHLSPEQYEREASMTEPCDKHPGFRYIS